MNKSISELFPDERMKNTDETILRQSQLVMLRILKIVDYICKQHNIIYWLDSGTLLGAARHKGFIPWDDDIDIVMPRENYNKFMEVAKSELPEDLFLQTNETDIEYDMPWMKIRDNNSRIYEYKPGNYHNGMFIDVFPVDYYKDEDKRNLELIKKRYKLYHRVFTTLKEPFEPMKSVKIIIKNILKLFIKTLLFPYAVMKREVITNKLNELKNKYIKSVSVSNGNYIGYGIDVMFWNTLIVSKDTIFPLRELPFEDSTFLVPNNYDLYLKSLFGDYMKLPPKEQRIPHNLGLEPISFNVQVPNNTYSESVF